MPTNMKPDLTHAVTCALFSCALVLKTALQKKQEFEEATSIVKPYEESMKKDNQDFEVFHNVLMQWFL